MKMYVRIEALSEGNYIASLIGWPDIRVEGANEDEVLTQLQALLATQFQQARIVALEVDATVVENPWLIVGDRLQHNPLLTEVAQAITLDRQQLDAHHEAA